MKNTIELNLSLTNKYSNKIPVINKNENTEFTMNIDELNNFFETKVVIKDIEGKKLTKNCKFEDGKYKFTINKIDNLSKGSYTIHFKLNNFYYKIKTQKVTIIVFDN